MPPHSRTFCVVKTGLPIETLTVARCAEGPPQPKGYTFNPAGRRVFEGWKTSQSVRDVAFAEPVLEAIRQMYGADPVPFQTINFDRGSNQKAHADSIHFATKPRNRIVGAWVALEDIHPDSGPLFYVPESDGMPFVDFRVLGLPVASMDQQYEDYSRYDQFMENLIRANEWTKTPFLGKAGEAFVWGIDMLHGGLPILDHSLTRHSLVVHYYLPPLDFAYAPMFGTEECPYRKSGRWFSKDGRLHELSEQA